MEKIQSIEEFYKSKLNWIPDTIRKQIGHFNVFRLDEFVGTSCKPIPYSRKDYYKISLIVGRNLVHYADKSVEIKRQALFFANPQVPYNWEEIDTHQSGFFCVFTPAFFHHFGNLQDYGVLRSNQTPVFELTDEQAGRIIGIYQRMMEEIESDYAHKYDVLRNLVFDLLHQASRLQPTENSHSQATNAAERITRLFLELLERQFPIEDIRQKVNLRSPSDFASGLSIHVNHLNRAVKQTMEKTTSEIIAARVLQEAKILLKHTQWNVSEISYSLGFSEVTHFNNFFRKHLDLTPSKFRVV